jgi:chromosome segregation ATPase
MDMLKKVLVIGGLVLVAAWACGNNVCREIGSYVRTGWKEIRSATKNSVSIDFEIKRAEDMIGNLDRTDDRLISALASEIQVIRRGEADVETMQTNLETRKLELTALNDQLKNWKTSVSTDLRKEEMTINLERKFRQFKASEAAFKAKVEATARHKERLEMIKQQRDALKAQKNDLAGRLEKLKTDLEVVTLAEARSKNAVGEVQLHELNELKTLVDGLEERVEKQMIILELRKDTEVKSTGGSKFTPKSDKSVMQEVDAYFGNKEEHKAAAAK